ncbi:MAG: hypothetical protein IKB79_03820 [Oscillospiraceae bacterium]|nr:hypothetical protein [Oscillospiraceae bacterium]
MKQKRKLILTVLIAALVVGLLVWRLWPRSLESLTGLDFDQAISLAAHTRTTVFESGTPIFVSHHIDDEETHPGTEHFDPMLDLFRNVKARPSLSNLLRPWLISGFSWTGPVDFLYGFVSCGDTATNFEMTDRGELTVGRHLYFITDEEQFTALWEYVTTHGAENRS